MCELTLVGQAYLWHQVRCIMGILLLIGQGKEKAEVMKQLLDIESHPR
jgi:tRNA pseudouridine38/39 synthase